MNPNHSVIDEVEAIHQCNVCRNVLLDAVALKCGHSYCKVCIESVMSGSIKSCPGCRRPIFPGDARPNFMLKAIIEKLMSKCNLCGRRDLLGAIIDHACPEEEESCTNRECEVKYKKKDKEIHEANCPSRLVQCQGCKEDVRSNVMDQHLNYHCRCREDECPLGCGTRLRRDEVYVHVCDCKSKIKKCEVPGCGKQGTAYALEMHDKAMAIQHVNLLKRSAEALTLAFVENKSLRTVKWSGGLESVTWTIDNYSQLSPDQNNPLTSPVFVAHGGRWRMILYPDNSVYLQLVSSVSPITVGMRVLLSSNIAMSSEYLVFKEGDTYGCKVSSIAENAEKLEFKVVLDRVKVKAIH